MALAIVLFDFWTGTLKHFVTQQKEALATMRVDEKKTWGTALINTDFGCWENVAYIYIVYLDPVRNTINDMQNIAKVSNVSTSLNISSNN